MSERLVESARDYAIFALDRDGRIVTWGAGAQRLFGYTPDEIIGQTMDRLFTPEDRAAQRPQNELRTAAAGQAAVDENWAVRKDGSLFWASGITRAIFKDGSVHGFAKVARDLTGVREAGQELEAAHARLQEFLNVVAHELNNPLFAMFMQLELLKRPEGSKEQKERALTILERNLERIRRLTGDLVDAARAQNDRFSLQVERVDLHRVIQESVASYAEPARVANVALTFEPVGDLFVLGDAGRLAQVVSNLLSNAVRFTPPGNNVTITTETRGRFAVVHVRDTGVGLTKSQMERLFTPFGKVRDAREHRRGLGLGLYLSKALVEQHGGSLSVHSQGPGRGSTFTFSVPLDAGPKPPS